MNKMKSKLFSIPYFLWIALFVIIPLVMLLWQSFFSIDGKATLSNYATYFTSGVYLQMTWNSVFYAFIITLVTFLISYPTALALRQLTKHKQLFLMLIIMPTWINLLLKAYAFIGIFGRYGSANDFLQFVGLGRQQLLFTNFSFIFVSAYISIPFMILPIFNSLEDIDNTLISASYDLGASKWQTFRALLFPLSLPGVKAGIQAVFIPSLSLFMLVRLIGGNRVITLGTAVEEQFLTNQNWGMGSTIGVILILAMIVIMYFTREKERGDV